MLTDILRVLRPALVMLVMMTLLTGVVYPLTITAVASLAFPDAASGSLILKDGQVVGSRLIGQRFDDPKFFWGRPSATGPYEYNAASSSGSNLGPLNPVLKATVADRVAHLCASDPDHKESPPVDLVTASGSGLDSEISPAAAFYQIARVAKARGLSADEVQQLVDAHIEGRTFGILGEPRVNVLLLNLALDELRRK